jgi:hypothetical protein
MRCHHPARSDRVIQYSGVNGDVAAYWIARSFGRAMTGEGVEAPPHLNSS